MQDYTLQELQACVLSRQIRNGDIGGMPGVRSEVPLAAICLAARHHAPDMVLYTIHGELSPAKMHLTGTSSDFEATRGTPHRTSLATWFDLLQGDALDWIFYGGMQIDVHGNVNLACVGDHSKPRFRGPGTAGGNSTNFARKTFVWVSEHTRRVFVPRVDFVCAAGHGDVDRVGWQMHGHGLETVVTPLCVMGIDSATGRMKIKSRHPGIPMTAVTENTGFDLGLGDAPETGVPTQREIAILREEVDPMGLLRGAHK
jgi:glutaconate CoA-transferase subunit B